MKQLRGMGPATLVLIALCALATALYAHEVTYTSMLTGDQIVNADLSMGSGSSSHGTATIQADEDELIFDVLEFSIVGIFPGDLDMSHGPNNTAIHLHVGGPTDLGPIGIDLGWYVSVGFGAITPTATGFDMEISGILTEVQGAYNMTADTGMTPLDVFAAMEDGNTYLQIHTTAHPDGDVRGQLVPTAVPTDNATWGTVKYRYQLK